MVEDPACRSDVMWPRCFKGNPTRLVKTRKYPWLNSYFFADSKLLLTACDDMHSHLYDVANGALIEAFSGAALSLSSPLADGVVSLRVCLLTFIAPRYSQLPLSDFSLAFSSAAKGCHNVTVCEYQDTFPVEYSLEISRREAFSWSSRI